MRTMSWATRRYRHDRHLTHLSRLSRLSPPEWPPPEIPMDAWDERDQRRVFWNPKIKKANSEKPRPPRHMARALQFSYADTCRNQAQLKQLLELLKT